MRLSEEGFDDLKKSEAYREFAYPDIASELYKTYPRPRWGFEPAEDIFAKLPAKARELSGKPWTVGYGQTVGISPDSTMTLQEAESNLRVKIVSYEQAVNRACTVLPTQGQFDALVSISWNVMSAVNPKTSSIIRAHNRSDWAAAARAFDLYNKANGKVDKGLTLRRKREGTAYLAASPRLSTDYAQAAEIFPVSQAVDPERSMATSQINIASTAAGGTAAVSAVAEALNAANAVKSGVSGLADWAIPMLLVAVVALCIYVVLQRNKQRKEGWA